MQDPNIRHLGTIAQLCRAIFVSDIAVFVLKSDGKLQPTNQPTCRVISLPPRHVLTIGKIKLAKQQCLPHMFSQYSELGPLMAEICWRVWGTSPNFNGYRILAALLHDTLVVGISQTAALNRGRHLYSAGWPSRWALAHISSLCESEW